jgi:hypothetical protein
MSTKLPRENSRSRTLKWCLPLTSELGPNIALAATGAHFKVLEEVWSQSQRHWLRALDIRNQEGDCQVPPPDGRESPPLPIPTRTRKLRGYAARAIHHSTFPRTFHPGCKLTLAQPTLSSGTRTSTWSMFCNRETISPSRLWYATTSMP